MSYKSMRLRAGLTQDEAAKSLGYADNTMICGAEKGKWDLRAGKLRQMATLYRCTVDQLLIPDEEA